ncbi:MAG: malate synthase A [Candidatus Eremiobacteraeota bacterium]|nr:malate synthase A [Candidatus Eremiobacteraeota bacterium]
MSRYRITAPLESGFEKVLTPEACDFLVSLHDRFEGERQNRLARRVEQQQQLDREPRLNFLDETASVRAGDWKVAPIPADLSDRRVEITGPVDRKMVINALNSGARVFMADFEDSNSPTFQNCVQGQINLADANRGDLSYVSPEGKHYKMGEKPAVLLVRPRGWHLPEKHFLVDGQPISGSLFDFGLYFFHNAKVRLERGTGVYFYLPKLEHYLEARLWNEVIVFAQNALAVPQGSVRATVLIETITAAFQMDEILYELREHSAGLNCGRWDYIFSFIKKFRRHPQFLLPDRAQVTMEKHFLASYVKLLIQTCHRRGIHAMGGMAAQIPIKNDPAANEAAMEKVRRDKQREVDAGHDGTWVAHPGLIGLAQEIFDRGMPGPNQIGAAPPAGEVSAEDLLRVPEGTRSEAGLRLNIDVGLQYVEAWLRGNGCVPIHNLMEDAATAEISRTQVWQWQQHRAALEDGRTVTPELVTQIAEQELARLLQNAPAGHRFELAGKLFLEMMVAADSPEFLTSVAYDHL